MTQISTFFGLQQSLRGLLAHQRAMDVTGHNITNANTQGYSRQEAVMAAATPYDIEAGLLVDGGGAQLGGGVDIQAFRRIRDGFLDLQYRAQSLRARRVRGHRVARSPRSRRASPSPARTASPPSSTSSGRPGRTVANAPENLATRQALVEQAKTLAARDQGPRHAHHDDRGQATAEYAAITGATGDVRSMADEIAKLNQAIKFAVADGDQPNDLYDRRDLLLDKLSSLAQVSVTDLGNGAIRVTFGDAATPLVDDGDRHLAAGAHRPRRQARRADRPAPITATPPGTFEPLPRRPERVRQVSSPTTSTRCTTRAAPAPTSSPTAPPAPRPRTLTVNVTATGVRVATSAAAGANDIAIAIAKLRGSNADQKYQALVARIGSDVRNTERLEANAKVLTRAPSTTAARAPPASRWTRR